MTGFIGGGYNGNESKKILDRIDDLEQYVPPSCAPLIDSLRALKTVVNGKNPKKSHPKLLVLCCTQIWAFFLGGEASGTFLWDRTFFGTLDIFLYVNIPRHKLRWFDIWWRLFRAETSSGVSRTDSKLSEKVRASARIRPRCVRSEGLMYMESTCAGLPCGSVARWTSGRSRHFCRTNQWERSFGLFEDPKAIPRQRKQSRTWQKAKTRRCGLFLKTTLESQITRYFLFGLCENNCLSSFFLKVKLEKKIWALTCRS